MAQDETGNPTGNEDPQPNSPPENRTAQLGLGIFFGVIFGFLLQKGGVAKYEVLIGMLLLEDFTVAKVMTSATGKIHGTSIGSGLSPRRSLKRLV
jgi:hypothetical protein